MSSATITFPLFGISFDPSRYFTVFGIKLYWYGVIIAVGFALAVIYAMKRLKQFGPTDDDLIDVLIFAVPSAIIGARLYYVIFNFSDYKGDFLRMVSIRDGGLAIYGGVIAAVIAAALVCKKKKVKFGAMMDIAGLGLLIGQTAGRWGNFMNREAYGGVTNLPWKMGLTVDSVTTYVHPTFLYESVWNLLGFALLHFYSKKHRKYDGQIFIMYVAWYGLGRFFIEGLRTDSLYIGSTGIRVSQVVAAVSFIVAVALLIYNHRKKHPPEELYVNQVKVIAAEKAVKAEEAAKEEAERKAAEKAKAKEARKSGVDEDGFDYSGFEGNEASVEDDEDDDSEDSDEEDDEDDDEDDGFDYGDKT